MRERRLAGIVRQHALATSVATFVGWLPPFSVLTVARGRMAFSSDFAHAIAGIDLEYLTHSATPGDYTQGRVRFFNPNLVFATTLYGEWENIV